MYIRQVVPDIIVIDPRRYSDERGWFRERYSQASWSAAGIGETWAQDNESLSQSVGTLRGLHFQIPPMAQAKVVSCAAGAILDVAVDIRRSSPTFGRHVSVELSAANGLLVCQKALPTVSAPCSRIPLFSTRFRVPMIPPASEVLRGMILLSKSTGDCLVRRRSCRCAILLIHACPPCRAISIKNTPNAGIRKVRCRITLNWL